MPSPQHAPQEQGEGDARDQQPPPSIRTYRTDVEQYMKKEGTTLADITAEELRHRAHTFPETPVQRNLKPLAISLFFLVVAGIVVASVLLRQSDQPETQELIAVEPLIGADRTETIVFEKGNRGDFLSRYQSLIRAPLPENELVFVAPIARAADGALRAINVQDFFSLLSVTPPDEFLRGLDGGFMINVLPLGGRNHLALIFAVAREERAIAGALRWEPTMLADLRTLYAPQLNTNTSVSAFEDGIMLNNDIRILRNTSGDPALIYALFSRKFFIITSSLKGLERLMARIGGLPS